MERGGLYDPALLPDFDPSIFGLVRAKLAQQDVVDADGSLVAPWDMAEKLRPGALVAVEANLIVYAFCRPSDPSTVCTMAIRCAQLRLILNSSSDVPDPSPSGSSTRRISRPCDKPPPPRPCVARKKRTERPFFSSLEKFAPHSRRQHQDRSRCSCPRSTSHYPPRHTFRCPWSVLIQEGYKGQVNNNSPRHLCSPQPILIKHYDFPLPASILLTSRLCL